MTVLSWIAVITYYLVALAFGATGRHWTKDGNAKAKSSPMFHPHVFKPMSYVEMFLVVPVVMAVSLVLGWMDLPHYRTLGALSGATHAWHGGSLDLARGAFYVFIVLGFFPPFCMISRSKGIRIAAYVVMFLSGLAWALFLVHHTWVTTMAS